MGQQHSHRVELYESVFIHKVSKLLAVNYIQGFAQRFKFSELQISRGKFHRWRVPELVK